MRKTIIIWAGLIIILVLGLAACNFGGESGPLTLEEAVQAGVQATLTKEAWLGGVEAARKTAIAEESSGANTGSTGQGGDGTPTPTVRPTREPTPTATLKPASVHLLFPGEISTRVDTYLVDYNTIDYADEGVTYGDQYRANIFERPFSSEEMIYYGYIDIIRVNYNVTDIWTYATMFFAEDLPDSGTAQYGLVLDLDENGRGDYLIQSELPSNVTWDVIGVKVYFDLDKDVGGTRPMKNDTPEEGYNGYEVLLFDSGEGDDPDLVWVRRNPDLPNSIQFAYKTELVSSSGYMWSAWADDGLQDVSMRDYNDRFTEEAAGNPYPGSPHYPIRAVYLFDSTCRSYYGFTPSGDEPGLCP